MLALLRIPLATATLVLIGSAYAQHESHPVLEALANQDEFSRFSALAEQAAISDRLARNTSYTVFAPTNTAFDTMPEGTYESLLHEANMNQLINLVDYHFVEASIAPGELDDTTLIKKALNGDELRFTSGYGEYRVNNVTLTETEVDAKHGVVYAIDAVLMPARDYAGN